jgi:hypothetical protein
MSRVPRLLALVPVIVLALTVVPTAKTDVSFVIDQKSVRVGGFITGSGNGSGMPAYLVPASIAPRPFACGANDVCSPRTHMRLGTPNYTFLGRFRTTRDRETNRRFRFRVPRVKRGAYKVVLWCRACGGSLILAGPTIGGQTVRIR